MRGALAVRNCPPGQAVSRERHGNCHWAREEEDQCPFILIPAVGSSDLGIFPEEENLFV